MLNAYCNKKHAILKLTVEDVKGHSFLILLVLSSLRTSPLLGSTFLCDHVFVGDFG